MTFGTEWLERLQDFTNKCKTSAEIWRCYKETQIQNPEQGWNQTVHACDGFVHSRCQGFAFVYSSTCRTPGNWSMTCRWSEMTTTTEMHRMTFKGHKMTVEQLKIITRESKSIKIHNYQKKKGKGTTEHGKWAKEQAKLCGCAHRCCRLTQKV